MTELYLRNNKGGLAKMELSAEQEKAVYTVLGLKFADRIEDGTMYSDRYVALITETIQGMIKRN